MTRRVQGHDSRGRGKEAEKLHGCACLRLCIRFCFAYWATLHKARPRVVRLTWGCGRRVGVQVCQRFALASAARSASAGETTTSFTPQGRPRAGNRDRINVKACVLRAIVGGPGGGRDAIADTAFARALAQALSQGHRARRTQGTSTNIAASHRLLWIPVRAASNKSIQLRRSLGAGLGCCDPDCAAAVCVCARNQDGGLACS